MTTSQDMRACSRCGSALPLTAEYFGHTPSGQFRSYCRTCKNRQTSEWQKENKWSDKQKWEKQNAARANAGPPLSDITIDLIRARLGDRCAYCGADLGGGGEREHMTPLDRGGTNAQGNLTLACMPCNRAKGNRTALEYLRYRQARSLPIRLWPAGTAPWENLME
ncbi:HNH endonuclease [Pseudoduganella violaceinigra]|uniref:HNH endonuclease n=1 Tax=Pseudoduganella violaceinigra TaxID=246602 RepID=UPI000A0549F8